MKNSNKGNQSSSTHGNKQNKSSASNNNSNGGNFKNDPERAREAGQKGGNK